MRRANSGTFRFTRWTFLFLSLMCTASSRLSRSVYSGTPITQTWRTRTKSIINFPRRGSRINTDRFPERAPKEQACGVGEGCSGTCSPLKFLGFQLSKVPFSGFLSHSDRILVSFNGGLLLSRPVADIRRVCSAYSRALAKYSPNLFFPIYYHTIYQISTWKIFLLKVYLFMKKLTDFRKTVETSVDPRLFPLISPLFAVIFTWLTRTRITRILR